MSRGNRRWAPWLLLAASLLGAAYSASGYVMAGSFTVSNPERLVHWQRVGTLYGAAVIVCLVSAFALSVYLIHSRRRSGSSRT
jgi:membrane protein DedA with SNARE-associated domain